MNPTEAPSSAATGRPRRPWLARFTRVAAMVIFTAMVAVISYLDGLFLIRHLGDHDRSAYLYPLLPDGLILICSIRLHEAAPKIPRWAMGGVILGVVLTLAMNVCAGVLHNWGYALADACVPVVFFVALEVVRGSVRRDQAGAEPVAEAQPEPARDEPETAMAPVPAPVPRIPEVILMELIESGTRTEIGDLIGISRSQVQRLKDRLAQPSQDGTGEPPAEARDADAREPIRYAEMAGSAAGG